jgi:dihydroorotate dehydrogenase (NAD+) catalytic subunit
MNEKIDLSVKVAGIKMKNPVMPASGTFGYGEEYTQLINISRLGAVVTKGTTVRPRQRNPPPRICETPGGMINFIGLENPGVEAVIKKKIPFLKRFGVPIIVNICGGKIDDYLELTEKLSEVKEVAALEVNISCPNVEKEGMVFGQNPRMTEELIMELREITDTPFIVKLTPNVTDIASVAKAAVEAGADAISLINTVKVRYKIPSGPAKGKWIVGGLSGPCIKPIALQKILEVVEAEVEVPIIGIGEIMKVEDALEFFEVGVQAIAVGTATFVNPNTMVEIIEDLEKHMETQKISSINELREKLRWR